MAKQNSGRNLEELIAETEKNRLQVQKVSEKLRNLKVAIERAGAVHKRAPKSRNAMESRGR